MMNNSKFKLLKEMEKLFKSRLHNYSDSSKAKDWLNANIQRVKQLFENYTLRDFIFEPFKSVFQQPDKTVDANIYSVITQVAIINAVMAGLPGKMGIGVWVSVALEAWMAFCIARHVGLKVETATDIWKYLGLFAATVGTILYGIRALLGIGFSIFSVVPAVNPLIFAELLVTDLVGVLFWVGFVEAKEHGSFKIPMRMVARVSRLTKGIFSHQFRLIKNVLSIDNIKIVGRRLSAFLKGDFPVDMRLINGEVFATAAVAYLISGHYEKLQGPLGDIFIEAIHLRWSEQFGPDTTIEEIAERFREYDADQIEGVINTIKGKMFEIMVTQQENLDGDNWQARMHTDESFPGSDIIFYNAETGEQIDVSLKAVSADNEHIIEHALARYPDIPIMTTEEMAEIYGGDDRVFGSSIYHEDLDSITKERFDELVESIKPVDAHHVVIGGVTVGLVAALWPFVMAYLRKKITRDQLDKVFEHVLGEAGVMLVSRISYAMIFGPLFAWYLLARGVQGVVKMAEPSEHYLMEFTKKESGHNVGHYATS